VFEAQKSTDGTNYSAFFTAPNTLANALSLTAETSYWFRVRAQNGNGIATTYDSVLSTVTLATAPAAVSNLTASSLTATALTWSWTDNATNERGYRVLRTTDGVSLSGDLPPNTTSWTQTGLSPNTTARVSVQVYNTGGILSTPAPAPVFTLTLPSTGTSVVLASATFVSLSWSANNNRAGTVFRLERSANSVDYFTAYSGTSTAAIVTSISSTFSGVMMTNPFGFCRSEANLAKKRVDAIPTEQRSQSPISVFKRYFIRDNANAASAGSRYQPVKSKNASSME
jgi:hypothetical protein